MEDALYDAVYRYLKNKTLPNSFFSTKGNFMKLVSKFQQKGGNLYRNDKLVVRKSEQASTFRAYHNHSCRDKCWATINKNFYWRGGKKYVEEKTNECCACKNKNNPN